MKNYDVIIIGGGASGMMTSIFCARDGLKTLVLEHNEKLGKKLFITGKGRCNLTNASEIETHLNNIVTNSKFMYSSLNAFTPIDTINFFNELGLKTKVERGNRVFPLSDKSSDVIKSLTNAMERYGVEVELNTEVLSVTKNNDEFNILCLENKIYTAKSVVVATGGVSYSGTGASSIGYEIAKSFNHNVVETKSALCPILVEENVEKLNGLSLRNVNATIKVGGKKYEEFGEMMFTYNSITGPIALTLSSKINKFDLTNVAFSIDLKPALSREKLEEKFARESKEFAKKDVKTYLISLMPAKLTDIFMQKARLTNKKVAEITKIERNNLINTLKQFDFKIKSLDNINVSIVTSGGVDTKEISSKTCESKLVKNLYFIGEVLDVDALTGGFNLQIAWSTAYACASALKG
ncbi:MAG: NAD(P)/FAD-dependent oxidoreductase [Clostridiales bacterium]|nr:NAD(P)/FAD-dependent oxidoreductase [Clostridiales bacterium]